MVGNIGSDSTLATPSNHGPSLWLDILAAACLGWYVFIVLVCSIGLAQLVRHYYLKPPDASISASLPLPHTPHVTVIRPVKGLEPYLYECLASTFRQTYPSSRLTLKLCVSSRYDPALQVLKRLLTDFPDFDAKIYVEDEDPYLTGAQGRAGNLGPNPKIRNTSRAYREAKGDILWLIDCNVWVGPDVCGIMVDKLCGLGRFPANTRRRKYKFVHQLPLVVDVSHRPLEKNPDGSTQFIGPGEARPQGLGWGIKGGGLLEEFFLSTSHAKFYTAISTVAVAPCIVGKSNMFRRSHLDALTQPAARTAPSFAQDSRPQVQHAGIDFFSHNICEDHLIGDLLWRKPVPDSVIRKSRLEGRDPSTPSLETEAQQDCSWGNHGIVIAPPCIQPLARLPLRHYIARRTRWLRVRKFTVPMATLVEPGTESLLCSLYGAFGATSFTPFAETFGIPRTWTAFWVLFVINELCWMMGDHLLWRMLQGRKTKGSRDPVFVGSARERKGFRRWVLAWMGREALAFPIWASAVLGGQKVSWRGRSFLVGMDARVREVPKKGR